MKTFSFNYGKTYPYDEKIARLTPYDFDEKLQDLTLVIFYEKRQDSF